ncbi:MAG TPA: glutamate racemase, partial [Firmicutes bacterium]|nr:glutamate racemase [Bacillota bacterium]
MVKIMRRILPEEGILYFGDSGRLPYGTRPPEQVRSFTRQILRFLAGRGIKAAVIACNTASAASLPALAEEFPFPLLGMIQAGARAALAATHRGEVAVMATPGTVASGAYVRALVEMAPGVRVHQQGCADLPALVERGAEAAAVEVAVRACLAPLLSLSFDVLLLGCTHFPFLRDVIRRVVGPGIALVDPAEELVDELVRVLDERGRRRATAPPGPAGPAASADLA